jgi:hypothetical protein
MSPERPSYYIVLAREDRVEKQPDGSLKFLHRSGEWKIVRPGTWKREGSTGNYVIKWAEYIKAAPVTSAST